MDSPNPLPSPQPTMRISLAVPHKPMTAAAAAAAVSTTFAQAAAAATAAGRSSSFCEHGLRRRVCAACKKLGQGGGDLCPWHMKFKYLCYQCHDEGRQTATSICAHRQNKTQCRVCHPEKMKRPNGAVAKRATMIAEADSERAPKRRRSLAVAAIDSPKTERESTPNLSAGEGPSDSTPPPSAPPIYAPNPSSPRLPFLPLNFPAQDIPSKSKPVLSTASSSASLGSTRSGDTSASNEMEDRERFSIGALLGGSQVVKKEPGIRVKDVKMEDVPHQVAKARVKTDDSDMGLLEAFRRRFMPPHYERMGLVGGGLEA
ncbi:hypothetical protein HK101_004942, partial [Irineochytrium annulatum]